MQWLAIPECIPAEFGSRKKPIGVTAKTMPKILLPDEKLKPV
jgi:hypothetical protein